MLATATKDIEALSTFSETLQQGLTKLNAIAKTISIKIKQLSPKTTTMSQDALIQSAQQPEITSSNPDEKNLHRPKVR